MVWGCYLNFVEWTLVSEFGLLHSFPTLTQTNSVVNKEVCMCVSRTLDHDNKKLPWSTLVSCQITSQYGAMGKQAPQAL
jgi:hypothetical protein